MTLCKTSSRTGGRVQKEAGLRNDPLEQQIFVTVRWTSIRLSGQEALLVVEEATLDSPPLPRRLRSHGL